VTLSREISEIPTVHPRVRQVADYDIFVRQPADSTQEKRKILMPTIRLSEKLMKPFLSMQRVYTCAAVCDPPLSATACDRGFALPGTNERIAFRY